MKEFSAEKIPSPAMMRKLFKELSRERRNGAFIVDYYLISIAARTGLRISELAALSWDAIGEDFLIVRNGKGGKARSVYFGPETAKVFDEFRKVTGGEGSLFVGRKGPLTPSGLHDRFKYWKERVGLPKSITMHSLRHYYATDLLDKGADLIMVRNQLGHSNIAVTSLYLHHTETALERLKAIT